MNAFIYSNPHADPIYIHWHTLSTLSLAILIHHHDLAYHAQADCPDAFLRLVLGLLSSVSFSGVRHVRNGHHLLVPVLFIQVNSLARTTNLHNRNKKMPAAQVDHCFSRLLRAGKLLGILRRFYLSAPFLGPVAQLPQFIISCQACPELSASVDARFPEGVPARTVSWSTWHCEPGRP